MFSVLLPPRRRAVFAARSTSRSVAIWLNHVAFVVRVTPARSNPKPVFVPPVLPLYESFSTRICSRIIVSVSSPFAKPAPLLITCTHTGMIADDFPFCPFFTPASIWAISSSPGCFVPHRSGCGAANAVTPEQQYAHQ